jgi:hypothetical protein
MDQNFFPTQGGSLVFNLSYEIMGFKRSRLTRGFAIKFKDCNGSWVLSDVDYEAVIMAPSDS